MLTEELLSDFRGEIAVNREIVPFEHVADHARRNHPTFLPEIHVTPRQAPGALP
ncbi:MAG: hypothetical protein WBL84_22430 [Xanthobacteraceae bacterium]